MQATEPRLLPQLPRPVSRHGPVGLGDVCRLRLLIAGRRAEPVGTFVGVLGVVLMVWGSFELHRLGIRLTTDPRTAAYGPMLVAPLLGLLYVAGLKSTYTLLTDRRYLLLLHGLGVPMRTTVLSALAERWLKTIPLAILLASFVVGSQGVHGASVLIPATTFVVLAAFWASAYQVFSVVLARIVSARIVAALLGTLLLLTLWNAAAAPRSAGLAGMLERLHAFPLLGVAGAHSIAGVLSGTALRFADALEAAGVCLVPLLFMAGTLALSRMSTERLLAPALQYGRLLHSASAPNRAMLRYAPPGWPLQAALECLRTLRRPHVIGALCGVGAFAAFVFALLDPWSGAGVTLTAPFIGTVCGFILGSDGTEETLNRDYPYRFHRVCGADPAAYGIGLVVTSGMIAACMTLAAGLVVIHSPSLGAGIRQVWSAVVLAAAQSGMAAIVTITLFPVLPRLGLLGKLKLGLILPVAAVMLMALAAFHTVLPLGAVALFLVLRRRWLGSLIHRRIWHGRLV